jgi:tRNA 2-thiouridine synthesizing protein A
MTQNAMYEAESVQEVDATGLTCPMPLLKAKRALNGMAVGACLRVRATDPGAPRDFQAFCQQSGHELLSSEVHGGTFELLLRKV